jgi:ubiquinone/menaquinone biosynthesis C-methylase UbiE
MTTAGNLETFKDAKVVEYYKRAAGLRPCEAMLFERWLKNGMAILDIGVGGGRTTPYLSQRASRYVAVDYSSAMVEVCRNRFPGLDFRHCDATDLGEFGDGEFDAVVFSANGIDYIPTDARRRRCMSELCRITKSGGIVILSSHNAKQLVVWPALRGAGVPRGVWRLVRSIYKSVPLAIRTISSGALSRGAGYIVDFGHWGSLTHVSTPESIASDARSAGLEIIEVVGEVVGGHFPTNTPSYLINWYHYVLRTPPITVAVK